MGRKKHRQSSNMRIDTNKNGEITVSKNINDKVNGNNNQTDYLLVKTDTEIVADDLACKHVLKSIINLPKLRKILRAKINKRKCTVCKSTNNGNVDQQDNHDTNAIVWFCFKCANQTCSRVHAEEHHKTPHSDSHCLALDICQWVIWCFACNRDIDPLYKRQLTEILDLIKKWDMSFAPVLLPKTIELLPSEKKPKITHNTMVINNIIHNNDNPLALKSRRLKGLVNLGNTCFFNAVLQCLAQTPYLIDVLQDIKMSDKEFFLPGGRLNPDNSNNNNNENNSDNNDGGNKDSKDTDTNNVRKNVKNIEICPPIKGSLKGCGNFTSVLHKTLVELHNFPDNNRDITIYKPFELLNLIKKNTSQFTDGDQHDAHELLRFMLELIRNEDFKRYQTVITKEIGGNCDTVKRDEDSGIKCRAKFYANQVNAQMLGVEPIFHGLLVSKIQCTECRHSLRHNESFLDLSIPVIELDKLGSVNDNNDTANEFFRDLSIADDNVNNNNSNNNNNNNNNSNNNNNNGKVKNMSKYQFKKEKKLMKKNYKISQCKANADNVNSIASTNDNGTHNDRTDVNPVKLNESSVDTSAEQVDDWSVNCTLPISDTLSNDKSVESTIINNETTVIVRENLDSSTALTNTATDSTDTTDTTETRKILNYWTSSLNSRKLSSHSDVSNADYSVQSCLNQFTAPEMMSGSNKIQCDSCTSAKRDVDQTAINGDRVSTNGKIVYTSSTKQYLISQVPAVLVLHLKRFQSRRFINGFHKLSKHVNFPMLLDLSTFCENSMKPKLYSLYGVIEHRGTMHGGHYVAYVKLRKKLDTNDPRWKFLLKNKNPEDNQNGISELETSKNNLNSLDDIKKIKPSLGRWFCASDSKITEVDENTVLQREAYILFYERIL